MITEQKKDKDVLSPVILIVDDEENLNKLMQKTLQREGFAVEGALNGTEALRRITADPDLILVLDYEIEDFTGRDIIRLLNSREIDIPFIIVTGRGDENIAVEMMKLGARDYILKGTGLTKVLPRSIRKIINDLKMENQYKEARRALKESESKFRSLFDQASESIFLLSPSDDGLIIEDANDTALKEHGYTHEELIGSPITLLDDPETARGIPMRVSHLMNGKPVSFEGVHVRKDGTTFPVEVSAQMIQVDGRPYILAFDRNVTERKKAEEQLRKSRSELSVLYRISSTVNQTIDLKKLLDSVLQTVIDIEILNVRHKGGIFIVEGDRMKLVSHVGFEDDFDSFHKDMKVGDCLCGIAAEKGEIIISGNSDHDSRHTIRYPGMSLHGHIIIPLKVKDKVNGVLFLYLPTDFEIEESKLKLFETIGHQIGVAIENARLYEETKQFSLHDPLTGLANRRYMDIVLGRSFAQAKRFKMPFSVIMADIDHFKRYNDTQGHIAGDEILVKVAQMLQSETREVDLVARYGGEEFLTLLSEADLKRACKVAENKRKAVEKATDITISLGVATFCGGNLSKEELLKNADKALYKAKHNGRNRVEAGD